MFIFLILFSFFLEHAFSMCISFTSYLHPLFSLVVLVVIAPYFSTRREKYFLLSFFLGLFYDITYTNTVFFNGLLFLAIAFFQTFTNRFFQNNMLFSFLTLFLSICVYQICSFLILCMIGFLKFDFGNLLIGIAHSIVANLLYGFFLFFLLKKIDQRFSLRKN